MDDKIGSIGHAVAEIEHEHTVLVDRLARLREMLACRPGEGRCEHCGDQVVVDCWEATTEFLADLLDYMQRHFRVEEVAMRRLARSHDEEAADAAHVEAHADMMERAARVVGLAELQEERMAAGNLLESWLREHIAAHDLGLLARMRRAVRAGA